MPESTPRAGELIALGCALGTRIFLRSLSDSNKQQSVSITGSGDPQTQYVVWGKLFHPLSLSFPFWEISISDSIIYKFISSLVSL